MKPCCRLALYFINISFLIYFGQSSTLDCYTPTDCTNVYNSIDKSGTPDQINLLGYQSGTVDGSITASNSIWCHGGYSCMETPVQGMTNQVAFHGSHAGYNSSSITALTKNIYCAGSNSCSYSIMQAALAISCSAEQACSYSTMEGATIYGYGAYSLKNATINSANTLTVYFYGYHSGFGTIILCQSGDSCTINCYGNACQYLMQLQCLGSNPICSINYYQQPDINPSTDIFLYDSLELTTTNNYITCEETGTIKYDDGGEYKSQPDLIIDADTVPAVCIRGNEACESTSIQYNGTLICSGRRSFAWSGYIMNYFGDIFCEGLQACAYTIIYSRSITSNVYCLGSTSCQESHFIAAGTIYCSGTSSCANTVINSTGNGDNLNVYFMGAKSMDGILINCKESDTCHIMQLAVNTETIGTINCIGECIVECPSNYNCPVIVYLATIVPSMHPSVPPSIYPSIYPSMYPSLPPSYNPSIYPSMYPSVPPSIYPSMNPSLPPTYNPSIYPTFNPSMNPTQFLPSLNPTMFSTNAPSTYNPSSTPTDDPTYKLNIPAIEPTYKPTISPTDVVETMETIVTDWIISTDNKEIENDNTNNEPFWKSKPGIIVGTVMVFIIILLLFFGLYVYSKNKKLRKYIQNNNNSGNALKKPLLSGDNDDNVELSKKYIKINKGVNINTNNKGNDIYVDKNKDYMLITEEGSANVNNGNNQNDNDDNDDNDDNYQNDGNHKTSTVTKDRTPTPSSDSNDNATLTFRV